MSLRPSIVIVTLMVSLLAGCSDMAFRKHDEPMLDNTPPTPAPKISTVDDEKPIKIKTSESTKATEAKIEKGTGVLVNEAAARLPPPNAGATPPDGSISFNFENTPIQAVAQNILGALLHENYTIAPNVTGNVTFSTSQPDLARAGDADPRDAAVVDQQRARSQRRPLRSAAGEGCNSRQPHAAHRSAEARDGLRSARVPAEIHLRDGNAEAAQALSRRPMRSSMPMPRAT